MQRKNTFVVSSKKWNYGGSFVSWVILDSCGDCEALLCVIVINIELQIFLSYPPSGQTQTQRETEFTIIPHPSRCICKFRSLIFLFMAAIYHIFQSVCTRKTWKYWKYFFSVLITAPIVLSKHNIRLASRRSNININNRFPFLTIAYTHAQSFLESYFLIYHFFKQGSQAESERKRNHLKKVSRGL